jgi:hypothetical protein
VSRSRMWRHEDILLDDNWTDLKWDSWYWKRESGLANTFQLHGINFCQMSKTNSNFIKITPQFKLCSFSWWRFVKKICLLRELVFIFATFSVLSKPCLFREVAFIFISLFIFTIFCSLKTMFCSGRDCRRQMYDVLRLHVPPLQRWISAQSMV